jgi:hypothetical protein
MKDSVQGLVGLARPGRRDFLRIGATAMMLAAVGSSLCLPGHAEAAMPDGIKIMTEDEYQVFQRLMEVMLPAEGTTLVPYQKIPVLQTLDAALLATLEPHILQGLKQGIVYFNDGPKADTGKRFTELSDAEAARFCDAWANSSEVPQRALAMGLKKLVGLAYWANPPTWVPLGYDGPVTRRWKLKSYGNAPMPRN